MNWKSIDTKRTLIKYLIFYLLLFGLVFFGKSYLRSTNGGFLEDVWLNLGFTGVLAVVSTLGTYLWVMKQSK